VLFINLTQVTLKHLEDQGEEVDKVLLLQKEQETLHQQVRHKVIQEVLLLIYQEVEEVVQPQQEQLPQQQEVQEELVHQILLQDRH
jgi:hypothetical protein